MEISYIDTSIDMLNAIKEGQSSLKYEDILAKSTEEELKNELKSDAEKLAFWVNIYNAYIQIILLEHPEYYDKRTKFFSDELINIGGRMMSFSEIEHGIIRKSQWVYALGYIQNPFVSKYQRIHRVKKREPRVHFALNCGAKSCPPIAILYPTTLNQQLDELASSYLPKFSTYDAATNTVNTTPLFSWFRGDFGGKKGIKRMLKKFNIIPTIDVNLKFEDYDWTLDLRNFVEDNN